MKRRTNSSLADDSARLPNLDRCELVDIWQSLYGEYPPANISHPLMLRALAYRLQEKELGGLKPATARYLQEVARNTAMGRKSHLAVASIRPGTRFLREWRGITYEVIIQSEGSGVLLNGEPFKSLTAATKKITGSLNRSGPAFFGLRGRGRKEAI